MISRFIRVIVLIVFINYIFGCTAKRTVSLIKDELSNETNPKIIAVILSNGEEIKFNEKGGHFSPKKAIVKGTLHNGKPVKLLIADIKEIRTSQPEAIITANTVRQNITEVILLNDMMIKFDSSGGTYSPKSRTVSGIDEQGKKQRIFSNSIREIRITQPDCISLMELKENPYLKISELVTYAKQVMTFDSNGGFYEDGVSIVAGWTPDQKDIQIDLNDVLYVKVLKSDPLLSIVYTFAGITVTFAILLLIIALTKESCPFVYSYDGSKYIFDAEPLGGATSKGLQRTEYSKLEHLKSEQDRYKLLVRNEVEETQHLDELGLYYIDHSPHSEIIIDSRGNPYLIEHPVPVSSVYDENDNNLIKFFSACDEVFWQTKMPVENLHQYPDYRQHLTFSFSKPVNVNSANLIIQAGTTLWGSYMIKQMLEMHGNKIDEWYQKVDNKQPEYYMMMNFLEREELYTLKIYVQEQDTWTVRGTINGGGPFMAEKRIVSLDLSQVQGNSVRIRLNPPLGFWTLDYVALDYHQTITPELKQLRMISATDPNGIDISAFLISNDSSYYIMPNIGDWFKIEFAVTNSVTGMDRSLFLKLNGFYDIHLNKDQPEQTALLYEIGFMPGKIIDYSLHTYEQWYNQTLSINK